MDFPLRYRHFLRQSQTEHTTLPQQPEPLQELLGASSKVKGVEYVFFCSNDRLGLAAHPKVRENAARAARRWGVGLGAPFLGGRLTLHDDLEQQLAEFLGREASVVFNSGYLANVGVVPALAREDDLVVIDRHAHACIQDGFHLCRANKARFAHNDSADLDRKLREYRDAQGRLVVVEGVYSMSGEICPLPDIVKSCRSHQACLMVDDAHGFCTLGSAGRGTPTHFGLESDVDLLMGTFNKGLGSLGGFVAGDEALIGYLRRRPPTLLFTAAITPPQAAAAIAALNIMKSEPERFDCLWRNTRAMQRGLRALGFDAGASSTPIIPVRLQGESQAAQVCVKLLEQGIFTQYVTYPAIPRGVAIIRLGVMATHTDNHINQALDAFRRVGTEMGILP